MQTIKLSKELESGATAESWLIVQSRLEIIGLKGSITLTPYLNRQAYLDGKKPIGEPKVLVVDLSQETVDQLYTEALEDEYFQGGTIEN